MVIIESIRFVACHRIGQKRNVDTVRLVARGTIEELMYARQVYKVCFFCYSTLGVAAHMRPGDMLMLTRTFLNFLEGPTKETNTWSQPRR